MRKIAFLFCLTMLIIAPGVFAKASFTGSQHHFVSVNVDSAFIRAEPLPDSPPVGSAFQGEFLQAIGRNADGTWFEIQRAGGNHTGWISGDVISKNFDAWLLPLTSTAGTTGPEPVTDTGLAVFVLDNTRLRSQPFVGSENLAIVPHSVTLPVVGRNQDATWLRVNYNGFVGWISASLTRSSADLMSAPLGFDLPPLTTGVEIIPPEVQLAQLQRLRDFITPQMDLSGYLRNYWDYMYRGEILPCSPPSFSTEFQAVPRDIQELPELNRYLGRVNAAIDSINDALRPLQTCGIYNADDILSARNSAINANLILVNVGKNLDDLEEFIHTL
jgi:uncharacterized protein YraI